MVDMGDEPRLAVRTDNQPTSEPRCSANVHAAWPVVTFALFTYNQAKYVSTAIDGAFSQDYQNLEIIVSDDCSTDETWQIIEERASAYRGKHSLVIRRTEKNIGVCGNVNEVFGCARGELIVMAAGDDISRSDRASVLVAEWRKHGCPQGALCSLAWTLPDPRYPQPSRRLRGSSALPNSDTAMADFLSGGFRGLMIGAVAAYTTGLWRALGPLTGSIEDVPLTFRALLLGKVLSVHEPLVSYRLGGVSRPMRWGDRNRVNAVLTALLEMNQCLRHDYDRYIQIGAGDRSPSIIGALDAAERSYTIARWLARRNPIMWVRAFAVFPFRASTMDRIKFILMYFGLDINVLRRLYGYFQSSKST